MEPLLAGPGKPHHLRSGSPSPAVGLPFALTSGASLLQIHVSIHLIFPKLKVGKSETFYSS